MNLSSSEDEGYSSNDDDIANILHHQKETNTQINAAQKQFTSAASKGEEYSGDDSEDSENVDWEDASVDDDDDDDDLEDSPKMSATETSQASTEMAGRRSFPTKDVIVHFEKGSKADRECDTRQGSAKKQKQKQRKNKRMKKIKSIPLHMQNLLRDLHRSHMMCMISRAMCLSSHLGSMEEELWSVAYSAIPPEFINENDDLSDFILRESTIIPSYKILKKFCLWFFDYVNNVEKRRQGLSRSRAAAGAPRNRRSKRGASSQKVHSHGDSSAKMLSNGECANSCTEATNQRLLDVLSYLSPINDAHPEQIVRNDIMITSLDKLLLFCTMTRSLRWRVRLVSSLDPMKRELTVDHPLFSTTIKSTFRAIVKSAEGGSKAKRKKRKREREPEGNIVPMDLSVASLADECHRDFVWTEVLCMGKQEKQVTSSNQHPRWTHIDPNCQLFDQPAKVELIDTTTFSLRKSKNLNNALKHVSYVIGIEHFHGIPKDVPVLSTTRIVDITPRYSNKWSQTLQRRGASAKEIANGKCPDRWWSRTVKKINAHFIGQRAALGISNLCMDKKKKVSRKRQTKLSPVKVETYKKDGRDVDVLILDDSSDEENKNSHEQSEHDSDELEQQEFASSKEKEAIPTSKAAFKNHPLYIIPSVLKSQEVLAPDAKKRVCGIFKGEMVYKRRDASTALIAKKWLYQDRKVRENELKNPAKIVKARKKPEKKGFQALSSYGATTDSQVDDLKANPLDQEDDGKNKLYGIWQTKKWSPPYVGPNDRIPVNPFNNVELALLNPGLVHLELYRVSQVAKQLGVPYAPCLLGFEGHGGNRTPTIRGIVVHEHNDELLREAHVEMESQLVEDEYKERQRLIYGKWKRLIKGVLTKERLAREYVND